ncbi:MAG: hypothetical protein FD174_2558 [Geobacteraceae bacterium]|nr:MAG: hypothetical protein FD174_2558 [Geobacteraceae bacterium]
MKAQWLEKARPHLLPVLALLAVTAVVYGRALGHEFLTNWDDHLYVTGNRAAQGFSPEHLRMAFTRFFAGNYAPLQIISYMADYSIWGMRPVGYILTNILLHTANALMVYWFAFRLTRRQAGAAFAALLFLVHPVQVESVAWISQRKNLLAMFFFLVAFLLYVSYAERRRQRGGLLYLGSVAAFVLALLVKSAAVVFPPALVVYDLCFEVAGEWKKRLPEKLPYAVAALAVAVLAMISQSPEYHGGRVPYHGGSLWATVLTMLPVLARYLAMMFWPAQLSAMYAPPVKNGIDAAVAGAFGLVILLAIGGILLYRWKRGRVLFFGYSLFFLGFLPVSQIVPLVTLMNDRYFYFPMFGAALAGGGLLALSLEKAWSAKGKVLAVVLGLWVVLLSWFAYERVGVWQNSVALWSDAVAKIPGRKNFWKALGESHEKSGMHAQALASYRQALAIDPDYCEVLNNVGLIYIENGDLVTAREYLERVTRKCPTYSEGFQNLGHDYYNAGRIGEAEAAYRRALQLEPRSVPSLIALGNIGLQKGELTAARSYFTQARSIVGDNAEIAYNMACLEALGGKREESLRQLEAAFRLGFRNLELLRRDPYLSAVRSLPEFAKLVGAYFGEGDRP